MRTINPKVILILIIASLLLSTAAWGAPFTRVTGGQMIDIPVADGLGHGELRFGGAVAFGEWKTITHPMTGSKSFIEGDFSVGVGLFNRLEVGAYLYTMGTENRTTITDRNRVYNYPDIAGYAHLRLWREGTFKKWFPALGIGIQNITNIRHVSPEGAFPEYDHFYDFADPTDMSSSDWQQERNTLYAVFSKTFGNFGRAHIGVGNGRFVGDAEWSELFNLGSDHAVSVFLGVEKTFYFYTNFMDVDVDKVLLELDAAGWDGDRTRAIIRNYSGYVLSAQEINELKIAPDQRPVLRRLMSKRHALTFMSEGDGRDWNAAVRYDLPNKVTSHGLSVYAGVIKMEHWFPGLDLRGRQHNAPRYHPRYTVGLSYTWGVTSDTQPCCDEVAEIIIPESPRPRLEITKTAEAHTKSAEMQDVSTHEIKFELKGVMFDTAKATLRPEAFPILDKAAAEMKRYSLQKIRIEGHTDSRGSIEYNQDLSERRAESVLDYFVQQQAIDPNRITAIGYGELKPIATNTTAEGLQKNRRVEIIIEPYEEEVTARRALASIAGATYTITVTNNGEGDANDTVVRDRLPEGFTYREKSCLIEDRIAPDPTIKGQMLIWELSALSAGNAKKITYDVDIRSGALTETTKANEATVSGYAKDGSQLTAGPAMAPLKLTRLSVVKTGDVETVDPTVEVRINLGSVLFDTDKDFLREDAMPTLHAAVKKVRLYPDRDLLVEGHTDSRASDDYNQDLSERRARSVRDYFVNEEGIVDARISSRGYGESRPIATNETDEGRQLNRRVELVILPKEGGKPKPNAVHYTITIANMSEERLKNIVITDELPSGLSYLSESTTLDANPIGDPQKLDARHVEWAIPALDGGQEIKLAYSLKIPEGIMPGPRQNSVKVTATDANGQLIEIGPIDAEVVIPAAE